MPISPPAPLPRYVGDGVRSDTQLRTDATEQLERARAQASSYDFTFRAVVPTSLHRGQVVRAKGDRSGVITENPPLLDLCHPLTRHHVSVRWENAPSATLPCTQLLADAASTEKALSALFRKQVAATSVKVGGTNAVPFRASLDGTLLTVDTSAYELAVELHASVTALGYSPQPVTEGRTAAFRNETRFYRTTPPEEEAAPVPRYRDVSDRRKATVTNRKAFTRSVRADPCFDRYADENIASVRARDVAQARASASGKARPVLPPVASACDAKQPEHLLHEPVVVPHWTTQDTVDKYVRATAVALDTSPDGHLRVKVKHADAPSQWTVPIAHVHPVHTCQEVRRGGAVFVPAADYAVGHLERIHEPNDVLVCGFVGDSPVRITIPAACTSEAWDKVLSAAFPRVTVRVRVEKHVTFTCAERRGFCVWPASTATEIIGFAPGCTYEATRVGHAYELRASHPYETEWNVRSHPVCDVRIGTTVASCALPEVVPVRPQYRKETQSYKHLNAYQRFPVSYLNPERPQRGILLFHEMGAGKSRTAIEMVQRFLEDRYWAARDKGRNTRPDGRVGATAEPWWGDRPKVVLFSPTQAARGHFLTNEVPQWCACWWTHDESTDEWRPMQHVYRAFEERALHAEIQAHEAQVRAWTWADDGQAHAHAYLSIVLNATNNMYHVVKSVRRALARKTYPMAAKRALLHFFGAQPTAPTFDLGARTDADEYYGRFFRDTFVIVDEMHRMCNAIIGATTADTGYGSFFYRALMEAPRCRIVGLTGTPMQKTAQSFAPMFNLLRGKVVVWTVAFFAGASERFCDEVYTSLRPLAATVWTDHRQSLDVGANAGPVPKGTVARIQFTPWERADVSQWRKLYRTNAQIAVHMREYELFPYAFRQGARYKRYEFPDGQFEQRFVKQPHLQRPVELARRVVGLVSYVSPPKVTAVEAPTLPASEQYPHADVRTCYLTMDESQRAYIQTVTKRKRELNQKQSQIEESSACNVNWGTVTDVRVLDGKPGALQLFFKGEQEGVRENHEELVRKYHALLLKVHRRFRDRDSSVAPYMRLDGSLATFSPKMHRILTSMRAQPQHKAVVYSRFVDGVGEMHSPEVLADPTFDTIHKGAAGLGMLGYVLEANGYVRLQFQPTNVFEDVWHAVNGNPVGLVAIRRQWGRDPNRLSAEVLRDLVVAAGSDVPVPNDSVHWKAAPTTKAFVTYLCDRSRTRLPASFSRAVLPRFRLGDACRHALGLKDADRSSQRRSSQRRRPSTRASRRSGGDRHKHKRPSARTSRRASRRATTPVPKQASQRARRSFPPMFVEYNNRCVVGTDHTFRSEAQALVLDLYNLGTTADLDGGQVAQRLTPQALRDVRTLLEGTSHGNAYAKLVQTLLVSTQVTEAVEFKDVREMHILEPPSAYSELEQMFGRVIRRGSHPGVQPADRTVTIRQYVMTTPYQLEDVANRNQGRRASTADELYWDKIIKRKYQTSQDFYALLKHMAVDCRSNLVLNVQSAQDTHLTCYEYPYEKSVGDWKDEEAPLYAPLDLEADAGVHSAGARAVDVARAVGKHLTPNA
jgi:hypothetical protein